jgi:hypothetical protein
MAAEPTAPRVVAVWSSARHPQAKLAASAVRLTADAGVAGDAGVVALPLPPHRPLAPVESLPPGMMPQLC